LLYLELAEEEVENATFETSCWVIKGQTAKKTD
jgi:hypothetical protein